jgi:hypothetical protein
MFSNIDAHLKGDENERTQHEIDVAAEYFRERVALGLGRAIVDFI